MKCGMLSNVTNIFYLTNIKFIHEGNQNELSVFVDMSTFDLLKLEI